jgi:hypothetical protein
MSWRVFGRQNKMKHLRVGTGGDYVQIDRLGKLTSGGSGTVWVEKFLGADRRWDVSNGSISESTVNSTFASLNLEIDNLGTDHDTFLVEPVPTNAHSSCDITWYVEHSTRLANTTDASMQWVVAWDYLAEGETTGTTGSFTATASLNQGQYARTIASGTSTDHFVQGDLIKITVTPGSGVSTGTSSLDFWGLRMRYRSDVRGQ